jgi:predicted amidohydrolase
MTFRIAVVQPICHRPGTDVANVADAARAIARAADEGAQFVCFPETYPGPWRMPATFDPTAAMVEAAAKHKTHVVFGTIAPIDAAAATAYNLICMAYPDGRAPARYRRTHPNGPWIYTGGPAWEFQWVPGDEFPVFDTAHGKVGLAMCSEVYMPEVSRALALRGAELIFMPAGKDKGKLWATWRTLIWARAIENLAIVVTTQNLFDHSERGLAMVASPEEILFESTIAGTTVVDVSLERVRHLRNPRRSGLVRGMRGQAGPARPAMAAARALRPDLSASAARSGGIGPSTPQAFMFVGLAGALARGLSAGHRGNQDIVAVHGADVDSGEFDRRLGLSRPALRPHRQRVRERFRHRTDAGDLCAARPCPAAGALLGRRLQRNLRWSREA